MLRLGLDHPKAKTIHIVPYDLAHLKNGSSKIHDGVDHIKWKNGLMAKLLSKFDIIHVNQKVVKRSAIVDFLVSRALDDYEPLNFDFSNEDLIKHPWKLNFNGTSNATSNRIRTVLVYPNGNHYPFTSKLDFDYRNNMAEYEACIMGICVTIECKIKVLEVYENSALTRASKLIDYRKLILELIKEFNDIRFWYLLQDEN
ncbi:polygalacturonase-like [Gossypium australe]|uniref:Polygalacturonase-like n=1 Tax=Gossypium australe TaxID=47621 RepID=A0A5B6VN31_9ROSI|nr:polygalacturonase-like [Gossypium australe]